MTQDKSPAIPHLAQRIGGKVSGLRRLLAQNPRLQRGEALRLYSHLSIQRDHLEAAMIAGTMDARQWRALSEVSRMLIDLGRSLGLVPAALKAGETAEPFDDEEDDPAPPEVFETNMQRRARVKREGKKGQK